MLRIACCVFVFFPIVYLYLCISFCIFFHLPCNAALRPAPWSSNVETSHWEEEKVPQEEKQTFPDFQVKNFLNCPVDISELINNWFLKEQGRLLILKPNVAGCPNCSAEESNNQFQSHTCLPPFSAIPSLNEPSQRIRRRPRWKDLSLKILILTVQWSWLQHWKWTYKLLPMSVNIEKKKNTSEWTENWKDWAG